MPRKLISAAESRYTTYVAWCLSLDIQPASFEKWRSELEKVSEYRLVHEDRPQGNGLLDAIAS